MRIKALVAENVPPVKRFEVEDLSDVIVLAGRNGVGKTRLLEAIMNAFRVPGRGPVSLTVEATSPEERESWGKPSLETGVPEDAKLLVATIQGNRRRRNWRSSVFQFESDRSIQKIQPFAFSFDAQDPFEETIGWEHTFQGLQARFQDTVHSLFRKVHQRRNQIASTAERLMREGKTEMKLGFSDPLEPFKGVFHQLLAPKSLRNADPKKQRLEYEEEGQTFDLINTLSSGEKEVVNIVFDILLRQPSDCIVFFDEPELHLHPELSHKLLNTLRTIGERNQFLFCTHSPDIITAALDQSVIFIGPPKEDGGNQALVVDEEDDTHEALRALGQSIGVIALGRRVVLIEGIETSLDKQTYGAVLRDRFPDLVLAPAEGRDVLASFAYLNERVLRRSIWGVDFFMLCDRDAIPPQRDSSEIENQSEGRLRVLPRYHLENYFLDEACLALVFDHLEAEDSWLRDPEMITAALEAEAKKTLSYVTALYVSAEVRFSVGNISVMPKGCHQSDPDELATLIRERVLEEKSRIDAVLSPDEVQDLVNNRWESLESDLESGEWRVTFPGKPILTGFASKSGLSYGRVKKSLESDDPRP